MLAGWSSSGLTTGKNSLRLLLIRLKGWWQTRRFVTATTDAHNSALVLSSLTFCPQLKQTIFKLTKEIYQDGWWRLEYEEVMAPAPVEESGAGLAGGEESCEHLSLSIPLTFRLTTSCHLIARREKEAGSATQGARRGASAPRASTAARGANGKEEV